VRRALRGLAAALVATAGMILLHVSPAHAAAPDRTGWWSVTQPSSGVVPNATAQPGELEIIGSPSGPAAFAAVHYTVPTDVGGAAVDTTQVTGTLTLAVAPNSSAQGANLQVCPTTSQWKPEEHGAMTDAPKYTCPATPVAGQVSPDNNTVTFKLESSLMTQPGAFDLAVVPNGQTPFFVKFAKPDERSLEVSAPAAPGPTSTDTGASSTSADTTALTPAIPPSAPVLTPTPSLSSPTGEVPHVGVHDGAQAAADVGGAAPRDRRSPVVDGWRRPARPPAPGLAGGRQA
jgi:hypothetical protein